MGQCAILAFALINNNNAKIGSFFNKCNYCYICNYMPVVSVIIPVYNVEPYIARCAHALFKQTLKDIEFLFIDDCSPDNSIGIMRQVLENYPERKNQVIVYRMPTNSGQAAVRMRGIKMATGSYIIHCDSDDYPLPMAYQLMYEKAREDNLDIVTCNVAIEKDGQIIQEMEGRCTSVSQMLQGKERWSLFSRLVRRELLEGIDPPVANMGEDMVISIQTQLNAKRTGHVDEVLYHYCFRDNSITNVAGIDARIARWETLMNNVFLMVSVLKNKYGYSDNDQDIILYKYNSRTPLRPLVHIPEHYNRWKGTFPEIDTKLLSLPSFSVEDKFWFVLIHLHLYHPAKCFTGWLKKHNLLPKKS